MVTGSILHRGHLNFTTRVLTAGIEPVPLGLGGTDVFLSI